MNNTSSTNFIFLFLLLMCNSIFAAGVSPQSISGAELVGVAKAKQLFDKGALFVDVRRDSDWENGRMPDSLHLELKSKFSKEALLAEATMDDPIVIYCNGEKCLRSSKAVASAVEWGFKKVYYFRDGFPAWKSAGYPLE